MNKRLILLAALVAGVWAGISYWPDDKKEEKADPVWFKLQPAKVKKIEQKSADSFALDVENGEWRLTLQGEKKTDAPLRASLLTVEALVNFVGGNRPLRRLGAIPADKAKDFGLDKPKSSVTFTADTPWTIELGDKNPTNDGIYAKSSLEPDECLLLDAKYAEQFSRKPEHYFDLRLADFPADAVAKIHVRGPAPGKEEWEIERGEKGFAFVKPADYAGKLISVQEVESYLRTLTMAKGKQMLLPPPPVPAEVYAAISIWRKCVDAPVTYELFQFPADFSAPGLAGQFFCRSSWQKGLLSLDKGEERRLIRDAFSLRERTVFKADVDGLRKMKIVRIERQGQPLAEITAAKDDKSGWRDQAGDKALSGMDMLIWQLSDLKYEVEPVKALPATAKHALDWFLYKDGERVAAKLAFYRDPALLKGRCWLAVDDGGDNYQIEDQLLVELTRDAPGESMPDPMSGLGAPGASMGLPPGMTLGLPPGADVRP